MLMRRRMIALLVIAVIGSHLPATAWSETPALKIRKNVKELTAAERSAFVESIHRLKETPSPYDQRISYYDQFVLWHRSLYICEGTAHDLHRGHGGPFFLPWHRVFIALFERALAEVHEEAIPLPYWDWTDPESVKVVFADDFMGGDGDPDAAYAVTTGPFRKGVWELDVLPQGLFYAASSRPYLTRRFGSFGGITTQPPLTDLAWALNVPRFDAEPYDMRSDPNVSFRNAIEGWWRTAPNGERMADPLLDRTHCGPDGVMFPSRDAGRLHNQLHTWTGGVIADTSDGPTVFGTMLLSTSPNDPVFFLNHANIDRLWAKWQALHGRGFEPASAAHMPIATFEHAGTFTPASVESIGALGYAYSDFVDSDDVVVPPAGQRRATGRGGRADFACSITQLPPLDFSDLARARR